jgi:hypothetical protein
MAGFKKTANVTLPLLKMAMGTSYFIKFLTAMAVGKQMPARKVTDPDTGEVKEVKEQPATVAQVTQYDSDAKVIGDFQVICSAVMGKELGEAYPDHSYVGKTFELAQFKLPGKRYNGCTIAELAFADEPEAETAGAEASQGGDTKPAKKK